MLRIVHAEAGRNLEHGSSLIREYASSLGFDLGFQDFEEELAALPGDYGLPEGCLLVAFHGRQPAGCVALRKLREGICEMKRLYVKPHFRGAGIGRGLAEQVIEDARRRGYTTMRLDTIQAMTAGNGLYHSLGFREIAPYYDNPIEGAVFMELDLT